jgi:hypothetical protein
MARNVICLAVFAGALCFAAPAFAQPSGYIAVSKTQIDPRMPMVNDGVDMSRAAPQSTPSAQGGQADAGVPLDQMGSDDQDADNGPAGDDPYSDDAVQTDTVYTA